MDRVSISRLGFLKAELRKSEDGGRKMPLGIAAAGVAILGFSLTASHESNKPPEDSHHHTKPVTDDALYAIYHPPPEEVKSQQTLSGEAGSQPESATGNGYQDSNSITPRYYWAMLTQAGFSSVQTAGIIGNASAESGGLAWQNLNEQSIEYDISGCAGFLCFTPGGGFDIPNLVTGNPRRDLQVQIYTIIQSGYGPDAPVWQGADTPASAAIAFMNGFERCSICAPNIRVSEAQSVYQAAISGTL